MQLADSSSTFDTVPTDSTPVILSEVNQRAYLRLKVSLGLDLRRQIFLAVCDDLALRDHLASCLSEELGELSRASESPGLGTPWQPAPWRGRSSAVGDRSTHHSEFSNSQLVSLSLNLENPDPLAQIVQWKTQTFSSRKGRQTTSPIAFQILGIEHLTRQSAGVQEKFLQALQQIGNSIHSLDGALLLWLPRPWLRAIQQSAPVFWNWRTALFEFEGDPTPVLSKRAQPTTHSQSTQQPRKQEEVQQNSLAASDSLTTPTDDFQENLWNVLTQDLARLNLSSSATESQPVNTDAIPATPSLTGTTFTQLLGTKIAASAKKNMTQAEDQPDEDSNSSSFPLFPAAPASSSSPKHEPGSGGASAFKQNRGGDLSSMFLNLKDAVTQQNHAVALQALQHIERLQQQQATPATLASAYQQLATLYRDRIEKGDTTEQTLNIAIWAYEQTLVWLDNDSPLRSDVLNDIGNLYWMLSRHVADLTSKPAHLEQAITTYQRAIDSTNLETQAYNYAMLQNNLGSAYSDLAQYRQPVENLQRSVQAYQEALKYRTLENDPARFAATQNNLGSAYWNLAQHQQPTIWLQRAILAYQDALHYYSPQQEPIYYAMIKNNLGTAYWNLAQCAQSGNGKRTAEQKGLSARALLVQAIESYLAALVYRTLETAPASHAATQNNLGTAHWHLAMLPDIQAGDRRNHLQQAVTAYTAALNAIQYLVATGTPAAITFDPFATHNNLGLAYYHLATDAHSPSNETQRSQALEYALNHHLQALQGWTTQPDFHKAALEYIIQTVRGFYTQLGTKGQNLALSKIPAHLLGEVMKRL